VTTRRRIAVTGLGVICALGRDQHEYWANLREGRHGIRGLDLFDPEGCLSDKAGQIETPPSAQSLDRKERRRSSRTDRLCMAAAAEAAAQAGLSASSLETFGVSLGSSTAGMLEAEGYCRDAMERGFDRAAPSSVLRLPNSAPADAVARMLGAGGPRLSNMTACASSAAAIGHAADLIRAGDAPGVIAGGGDGLCLMTYAGFNSLRLLDPEPCRPFDASRRGLSLGEGAGILVLEDWEQARGRGAAPLAEFLDYGASCDAHHMTAPHPQGRGAAAAMTEAIRHAGLSPEEIDHINAHGTGTPLNDTTEAKAIASVFGEAGSHRIPISASKSSTGHLLGGAGAVEAVTLILSLLHAMAPPTLGWTQCDDGVDLDLVANRPRPIDASIGLTNSFGFGGSNVSLIFKRCG
jgi:3-oxoacyl-[acyl-carrier-protein] synthase II